LEALAHDYTPKGVKFFYVYKTLAHPDWNNYVTPFSLEERLMHVAEAKRSLATSIPWLCDAMDNRFASAMGRAPNSEFIIGPDGKIVRCHGWNQPERLRNELAEIVGPVDNPTRPEDLDLPIPIPVAAAATGIVPRIERPEYMVPLKTESVPNGEPFYAKLRAEVTRDVLQHGKGTLYVGFLLDPLYEVHWNNLVAPIHVEVEGLNEVEIKPASFDGPEVAVEGDADPREFLVDVENWNVEDELNVSVFYYACSDEAGWCKPVNQSYRLTRKRALRAGFTFRPQYRQRILESMDWRDGEIPPQQVSASTNEISMLVGNWSMKTSGTGRSRDWELQIDYENNRLSGWSTFDRADPIIQVVYFDGEALRFLHRAGPGLEEVVLRLDGDALSGKQLSAFGDFKVIGTRKLEPAKPNAEKE
jgi:hypothetical protein